MSRLLFEIGTEAIPAGYIPPALRALEQAAEKGLTELRLPVAEIRTRGTAQRLVLEVDSVADATEDVTREVTGPRVDVAFKDGEPTPAAIGFARKNGVEVAALDRVVTDKGEMVRARVHEPGRPATEVLPDLLVRLVEGLSWPKTMTWNPSRFRFPRPIRWMVCLLDQDVLPLTLAGVKAGRATRGHRLLGPGPQTVGNAGRLEDVLLEVGVVVDPAERRRRIQEGLLREAESLSGRLVEDPDLLDEVVYLAEHPTVLSGSFDREFLDLPREVVITAMRSHQRYFAVEGQGGKLLPRFLVVAEGSWEDPSSVIAGNQRVLRARLADARFYWDVDCKRGLEAMAESLESVVWLEPIGTVREKAERVTELVDWLGSRWHAGDWAERRENALRAATLAKADLASEMIKDGKEFTGLQGVIGARYGEAQGEPRTVTRALAEQYLPRGAGDPIPSTVEGTLLAVADRLDTIVGCWSAGFVPSGSQDPYALRRAANGIVRIILEGEHTLSLREAVGAAESRLPESARRPGLPDEVLEFLRDRIAFFLREQDISYDVVDAVLAADADDPVDSRARARALNALRGEPDLERLVVGFKRAANILKGIDEAALPSMEGLDPEAAEPVERALHDRLTEVAAGLAAAGGDYPRRISLLLSLREPIDRFFDGVMVMSEDDVERKRRLALLAAARALFAGVFDPSRIVIEGEGS